MSAHQASHTGTGGASRTGRYTTPGAAVLSGRRLRRHELGITVVVLANAAAVATTRRSTAGEASPTPRRVAPAVAASAA